jgi:hypothetical protein
MKFRVWCGIIKKYVSTKNRMIDSDGYLRHITPYGIIGRSRQKVEYSTGFFDENGNEIFVGDFCRFLYCCSYDNDKVLTGEVEWSSEEGMFLLSGMEFSACTNIEIIGNINENPELVEDK